MSVEIERIRCRFVAPGPADPRDIVLTATGDSVTATHEQRGFSRKVCFGDTVADHRNKKGSNALFSYANHHFNNSPLTVDYYNFARTGFTTSDIVGGRRSKGTIDGCEQTWDYEKTPLEMAKDVVTNTKRAGRIAHYVTTGGINDTNWVDMLRDLSLCRFYENFGDVTWYSANGGGGKDKIVQNGGRCFGIFIFKNSGVPPKTLLAWGDVRSFNGNYATAHDNTRRIVREMLEAGADHVAWMLYYDMTPAEVDIGKFGHEVAGALTPAVAILLGQRIPATKNVPLLDPFFHEKGRQIRAEINTNIRNAVMGAGFTPKQLRRISLVPAPMFDANDMQRTAIGGSPHPSERGSMRLARGLSNAIEASSSLVSNTYVLRARANNRFATATDGGIGPMVVTATLLGTPELYYMKNMGQDKIALMSYTNYHYISSNGENPLSAQAQEAQAWETFTVWQNADGTVSLKAANNKWLRPSGVGSPLAAVSPAIIGNAEKFDLVRVSAVSLYSTGRRRYVSNWQASPLVVDTNAGNNEQVFRWDRQADGTEALLSLANDRYVAAMPPGNALVASVLPIHGVDANAKFTRTPTPAGNFTMSLWTGANRRYVLGGSNNQETWIAGATDATDLGARFTEEAVTAFAIRARANNKYVVAQDRGTKPLAAVRNSAGVQVRDLFSAETFSIYHLGGGRAVIYSYANNRYVVMDAGGGLKASATTPGEAGTFDYRNNADGSISLRASNNFWVSVSNVGVMAADGRDIGDAQKFDLTEIPLVMLRNINSPQFVAAGGSGSLQLTSAGPPAGPQQTFYSLVLDGKMVLMGYNTTRWVIAEGRFPLIANRIELGAQTMFEVTKSNVAHSFDVYLKASNGNYVTTTIVSDGANALLTADQPVDPNPPTVAAFRLIPLW
ncbi:MAG TPA: hypothetical protein VFC19_20095 [Candidatus Limnocylindrales bacterium]|nr:hypothetical protein [Candidatus Limnocylindrales bacterium]